MQANVNNEGRSPAVPQLNELGTPMPQKTKAPVKAGSAAWLVPTALLVLSVIPIAAGAFRLTQLTGGAEITPENARFFASPLPVVVHIVSVSLYAILLIKKSLFTNKSHPMVMTAGNPKTRYDHRPLSKAKSQIAEWNSR